MAALFFLLCLFVVPEAKKANKVITVSTLYPLGGQAVTELRAKILVPNEPLGSVKFFVNGGLVGSAPVKKINGQAVAALSTELSDPSTIVAQYGGKNSTAFNQQFVPGVSNIKSLKINRTPVLVQSPLKITLNVGLVSGPQPAPPTSAKFLLDDFIPITCQSVSKKKNSHTCTWIPSPTITTGTHKILGYFPGAGKYGGASKTIKIHVACPPNLADCNNDKICETNTVTDVNNCGGCHKACSLSNAKTQICSNSSCHVVTCVSGYDNCDGTGCEPLTSLTNCGGCGHSCILPHATSSCTTGTCEVSQCDSGFGICPPAVVSGCGVDFENDPSNCNGCGNQCTLPNVVSPQCSGGNCVFSSADCSPNFFDCDNDFSNGCEWSCPATPATQDNVPGILNETDGTCQQGNTPVIQLVNLALSNSKVIRYGTGNLGGSYTTVTSQGIVLALRAETRGSGAITPNGNLYSTVACSANHSTTLARWNYGFSVDLTNAKTGSGVQLTLADFTATISITSDVPIIVNGNVVMNQTLALVQQIQPFAAGILSDEFTDGCFTFPVSIGAKSFADSSDLINNGPPFLTFLQESTNIGYAFSPFPYTTVSLYHVTLALTPLSPPAPCACGLSVEMDVDVQPPPQSGC